MTKNIMLNILYMIANDSMKQCETHFKDIFPRKSKKLINMILAGDFKINFLNF